MPTKREYQEFAETLDKLMSDNLNRNFFKNRMATSFEDTQKGTIALLEEYFNRFMTARDRSPVDDMLKTFRKVRSERSKSSHHDLKDEFKYEYNHKQRDIMREAYTAIRLIRLAFTNAPDAKDIEVPGWLYKGEISPQ
jgi:F0F1-type ATP synthase gamma subunit